MSIDDGEQRITLGTIHAAAFKLLIWMGIIGGPTFAAAMWHASFKLNEHDWRISALERTAHRGSGNISGASINVGKAGEKVAESGRDYLTVQEVAEREGKDERTITLWIEGGRIEPAPTKVGKAWVISEDYRILPQVSGNFREGGGS
ncbi:MAG: helix-turn-helix domain-containing protein [Verrucomicrobiaceae bacterium]|nr:helix-turn-helix domain-containing protein [Verrucomicrobiaceae bacterium]